MDLKVKKKAKGKANHAYGIDSCVMENDIRTHNNDVPEWLMNLSHVTEKCLFLWFFHFCVSSAERQNAEHTTVEINSGKSGIDFSLISESMCITKTCHFFRN